MGGLAGGGHDDPIPITVVWGTSGTSAPPCDAFRSAMENSMAKQTGGRRRRANDGDERSTNIARRGWGSVTETGSGMMVRTIWVEKFGAIVDC
jgi:RNA 3'-terminal phosphate cyclase